MQDAKPPDHSTARTWIYAAALVLAGCLAYSNALEGEFLFDDSNSIVSNNHIKHLWPLTEALTAPKRTTISARPTICLTLALNYALCGMNVAGYRAVNVLIHMLAALTLFGIVLTTISNSPAVSARAKQAAYGLAFGSALLFELHPLQTSAVNYIIQRTESVMALCLLLTLYCVARGLSCSDRNTWRARWFIAAVAICAAGMGAKEVMVVAPVVVLLYDRTFFSGSFREALRQSWKLYAGLAATWSILVVLFILGGTREGAQWGRLPHTAFQYALTQGDVILYYLRLSLWPHPLCFDYGWPAVRSIIPALQGVSGVLLLLGTTVWALVKRPALGFLGAFVFICLAPSSSIAPLPDPAVEYRMYLPLAALAVLYVVAAWAGTAALIRRIGSTQLLKALPTIHVAELAGCAMLFGIMTFDRNIDFHSATAIWGDVARKRPEHARGHANFGVALAEDAKHDLAAGRADSAHKELELAASELTLAQRLKPDLESVDGDLANALAMLGRGNEALFHYRLASAADPDNPGLFYNLGNLLSELGKKDAAADAYSTAIKLDPNFRDAHYNLGADLFDAGKYEPALMHFSAAVRIDPQSVGANYMAGMALARLGRKSEAEQEFRAALAIQPDFKNAQAALNALLQSQNK